MSHPKVKSTKKCVTMIHDKNLQLMSTTVQSIFKAEHLSFLEVFEVHRVLLCQKKMEFFAQDLISFHFDDFTMYCS